MKFYDTKTTTILIVIILASFTFFLVSEAKAHHVSGHHELVLGEPIHTALPICDTKEQAQDIIRAYHQGTEALRTTYWDLVNTRNEEGFPVCIAAPTVGLPYLRVIIDDVVEEHPRVPTLDGSFKTMYILRAHFESRPNKKTYVLSAWPIVRCVRCIPS